ncbi:DUF2272 domain-containing protein [Ramlibacter ginsenosidimutans]|uniref:DUF2272 domain-containing protein n=1 Tax=Ramlibacter ginsenosidimutans TaxID=502333 RepID=A0A934TXB8_9BURK|nr:DUF2272 domain-containing protein [Ramlibacter ginsenosidimutans]MBK6009204.1 DUF2272 domain-containing protein [Ramlibacter ginsenosidimutans]
MTSSLPGAALAGLLCLFAAVPAQGAATEPSACAATARRASGDARILGAIEEARRQHRLFGAQVIERDGGLFHVGYHEAEWDRLPGESMPAWERVATFWRALSPSDPPDLLTSAGRVARSQVLAAAAAADGTPAEVAVREALLRAAIVDTPWSAAFISYLLKTAGFTRSEFAFSDTHADYVQAAFAASDAEAAGQETPYAFRACDVATTPPRAGDLLCATRESTSRVARFAELAAALRERAPGEDFPMHCDLVVRADEGGDAKIATIGGNVVQSVTLSHMTLNADKVLGDAYIARPVRGARCEAGVLPCRERLNRRPWLVLLQLRH